nr:hypothetical protein CcurKRNrm2_p106 [Cryptomonas curvata]
MCFFSNYQMFLNFYLKNYLNFSNLDKKFLKFTNKNFIYPNNLFYYKKLIYLDGNGGNGGGKKIKNFYEWNNNFHYFFFIILIMMLFLTLMYYVFIFRQSRKLDEIVLRNCESIPNDFFGIFFKLLLKKKNNHIEILKVLSAVNQWYTDRNYLFSSFKKSIYIEKENSFQLLFLGYEAKIKNVIKSNKTDTKILKISKMLQLITGNHFKWSYYIWKDFCTNNFFANVNFSTRLFITKNENIFIDIYIDVEDENLFTVKPGITFENNNLTGFISIDKKNIFGNNIDFNGTITKNYLNNFFLTFEIKKLTQPKFKMSIFLEKINRNYKDNVLKIVKYYGKNFHDKIEITVKFSEVIKYFFQKKIKFLSSLQIGFSNKIPRNNLTILPYFYLTFNKNNNYQPCINFDFKLRFYSKAIFLQKKSLGPLLDFNFTVQLKNFFSRVKKKILIETYQKKSSYLLALNESKIPVGFYLDFNSLITENLKFFFFIDVYKNLKKNKILGKSIGFGFKFNNTINISSIISSDGHKKIIIGTG